MDLPYASGYEGYWADNVCIQHPLAIRFNRDY